MSQQTAPFAFDPYPKFPTELKEVPRWVVWRLEERDGKTTKVLYDPRSGKRAKSTDQDDWVDYETAVEHAPDYSGLGCVIGPPYVVIDLDKCLDPKTGITEEWAHQIIGEVSSYTELSPSGRGYHIWVKGKLPEGRRRAGRVEMYDGGRYFTVTGNRLESASAHIEARDLSSLHSRLTKLDPEYAKASMPSPSVKSPSSKPQQLARDGEKSKFDLLMAGRCEEVGYASHSEADMALCILLAQRTGCKPGKVDLEFRRSGLMRPKWEREDYRNRTISRAIQIVRDDLSEPERAVIEEAEPEVQEEAVPPFPAQALDGDYLGELAHVLSDGTQIPPQFVRSNIKTVLAAIINGRVGFPGYDDLHIRQYNINISLRERTGKGVSWKRTAKKDSGALHSLLAEAGVHIINGGFFGSGQYLVKILENGAREAVQGGKYNVLVRFDEMKEFFQRDEIKASTLETKLLELYEESSVAQGSFTNGKHQVENVHLSFSGDFTKDGFYSAFAARGSRGSGFLARCVLSFGDKVPHTGDWNPLDHAAAIATVKRISEFIGRLPQEAINGKQTLFTGTCVPKEDEAARRRRLEIFDWLDQQDPRFTSELKVHFRRDLLIRVIFSGAQQITAEMTDRTVAWTQHQLELRRLLWPEDAGSPVERMERKILDALRKYTRLSDRQLVQHCNVNREGSGGREVYRRAIKALAFGSHEIRQVDETRKRLPIWGLAEP